MCVTVKRLSSSAEDLTIYVALLFSIDICTLSVGSLNLVCQVWKEDASGNILAKMWLLIFQLIGLNPSVIQTYSRLLTLLAVVCDDFAVYFFTFVMTHIVFTS